MKKQFDCIVVGQGIAGTLLTYNLQKHGAEVLVIDKYNESSSSNISAGIINPITGRRKVKTWMADILIPFAEKFYDTTGSEFEEMFFHRQNILELVDSTKDYNDWLIRSGDAEMKNYFSNENVNGLYDGAITSSKKVSLAHASRVDVKKLLSVFRKKLIVENTLLDEAMEFGDFNAGEQDVLYKDFKADNLIFCDGWWATRNPYWSWLPFLPAKGEILTIHAPQLKAKHILFKHIFILPLGEDLYKVGSNYEWKELDEVPTQKIKDELVSKLKNILCVPFEVVSHEAAVRPAIQDRRPVIGLHPKHNNIGIFNGLGTKGALLAPYFANQFVQSLYKEDSLNSEVDVKRFSPVLKK